MPQPGRTRLSKSARESLALYGLVNRDRMQSGGESQGAMGLDSADQAVTRSSLEQASERTCGGSPRQVASCPALAACAPPRRSPGVLEPHGREGLPMKRRFAAILTVPILAAMLVATSNAASASSEFDWHISDRFIQQGTGIPQTGSVAQADNGDLVTLSGRGEFDPASGDASGTGAFAHTDENGGLVGFGRWRATGVVDFDPYGCGGEGFPPNFCGGLLTLDIRVIGTDVAGGTDVFDGVLTIDCLIGPNVPAGRVEGTTLDIPGRINFDEILFSEGGLNLFVKDNG